MTHEPHPQRSAVLYALLVPAFAYLWWQYYLPMFTGLDRVDGSIGVLLGLYICSHPAANSIDLMFLERGKLRRILAGPGAARWLALNALVMLVGWFVIVVGASRLSARAA